MNWRKSYVFEDGSTSNLKTAFKLPAEERNKHHKRAKWLGAIGAIFSLTIFALPITIPTIIIAIREANKAERLRSEQ